MINSWFLCWGNGNTQALEGLLDTGTGLTLGSSSVRIQTNEHVVIHAFSEFLQKPAHWIHISTLYLPPHSWDRLCTTMNIFLNTLSGFWILVERINCKPLVLTLPIKGAKQKQYSTISGRLYQLNFWLAGNQLWIILNYLNMINLVIATIPILVP